MNDYGNGRVRPGNEMFAVVAAYNKKSGRFSARWGYSPNPKSGENSLEMTITNLTASAVGSSSAKHPVGFQLMPDFSSLTMSWGPRLEKRGTLMHTVTWNALPLSVYFLFQVRGPRGLKAKMPRSIFARRHIAWMRSATILRSWDGPLGGLDFPRRRIHLCWPVGLTSSSLT